MFSFAGRGAVATRSCIYVQIATAKTWLVISFVFRAFFYILVEQLVVRKTVLLRIHLLILGIVWVRRQISQVLNFSHVQ